MNEHALKILLVEDSDTDADLLIRFLKRERIDFTFIRVWSKVEFIKALAENSFDLIIADHSLPQFSGMEAFRIARSSLKNIPFILVTGTVSENILTEYAKQGVDDYILKENLLRLPSAIEHVISKKKIELLHKKLELAHTRMKDSINYAKTIQNAMLPDTLMFSRDFPESFILYKPKDILSGDFYWFKKDDDLIYVAAVDCTGHGVPGALMSMIGLEKLNNMNLKTKAPSEILNQLNTSIGNALNQSTQFEDNHDGMDIALCSIDKENGSMKFAGAYRPLWIIRNGKTEIEEIRGTIKGIGGITSENHPDFINHDIKLRHGDTFYIFSDGYADQFGGENKKKLTSKSFKQILINIQEKTMIQQGKKLNDFIENWRAGTEQIDDILIIGIRQM